MRKIVVTVIATLVAVVFLIGPILLLWVKNERHNRCEDGNENLTAILTVAQVTREFMNTFVNIMVSFADPNDPEVQTNVSLFLQGLQPAFEQFDEAVNEIKLVEC